MGSSEPPRRARRPWRQGSILRTRAARDPPLLTKPAAGPFHLPRQPGRHVARSTAASISLQHPRAASNTPRELWLRLEHARDRGRVTRAGTGLVLYIAVGGRLRLVPAPGTARAIPRPRPECRRSVYISAQRAVFSVQARDRPVLLLTWLLLVGGAKRGVSLGAAIPIPIPIPRASGCM